MARTKEFDREAALEHALNLFWKQGYEATSIGELVEATGVQRQSLYDTFTDKHGLYLAALDLYAERISASLIQTLSGRGSPLTRLRRVFRTIASEWRGCMLVNSAVERGLTDQAVIDHARTGLGALERAFRLTIVEAQKAGEVPRGTSPRNAARLLVSLFWGLRAMGRALPDPAWQKSAVDGALGLLAGR